MTRDSASSIRDILAIVDNGGERRSAAVAADLARRTGAHLTAVAIAVEATMPVYSVAAPIPTEFIVAAHEQSIADANAAIAAFKAIAEKAGVNVDARVAESVAGDGYVSVVRNSALTDLAVVGQDDPDRIEPFRPAIIEALLFQAGVPTLLVPYSGPKDFSAKRAVVAWNGSASAARAVRAALPLLSATKNVVVAIVDDGRRSDETPGADVGAYLARHDLDVTIRVIAGAANGAGSSPLPLKRAPTGW